MGRQVSERYVRLSTEIAINKSDLTWVNETLASETDPERKAALERRAARIKAEVERVTRLQAIEVGMSKHADNYTKALTELNEGLVKAARDLRALQAEQKKYPEDWYAEQHAKAVAKVATLDAHAQRTMESYQSEAIADATRIRAAAEVEVDPTRRLADEMLRMRLMQSPTDAGELARKGSDLLNAGQPEQAKVYIEAARDKGARLSGDVLTALEDALDMKDPLRSQARAIEEEFFANTQDFTAKRMAALVSAGLGAAENGQAGNGTSPEISRANVIGRMSAYRAAMARGQDYTDSDPAAAAMTVGAEPRA